MQKLKVAIFGASGYMGEELVRLLLRHPHVEISAVTSRSNAGQPIGQVFPRFGELPLAFCEPNVAAIAEQARIAFLALPHGLAHEYAIPLLENGVRVIDLSADFRLHSAAQYQKYYKEEHPRPELLAQAVYGAPERHREAIGQARLVACPGCYPTSITLPVCPLLRDGLVSPEGIIAASLSGVSGAGRKEKIEYLFSECNESIRPYGVTGHRHLPEIEQELAEAAGLPALKINFVPHLIPVTRGIHSTIFLQPAREGVTPDAIRACWLAAYGQEPFVRVLPSGRLADTKYVTMTNVCEMGCAVDSHTGRIIVSSAEDNLTKGGSGQAVQCLNIMCGFPETAGLL